jgi:DNA polymerase I-like protein with 3'-5' exonuclease and polymerase domains
MIHVHSTNYNPIMCALAIAGASVIYVDLETTGLHDYDRIVAAGILVGHDVHILFTDQHRDISSLPYQVSPEDLRLALSPLSFRRDLIAVFHNAVYDVAMLERAGILVNCVIHDTWKLHKLRDSDRGPDVDEETGIGTYWPRWERRFNEPMSYKLKDIARHLLGINAIDFPGDMATLPLNQLVRYLKSDLLATHEYYRFLRHRLGHRYWRYNAALVSPITPILVRMSLCGVQADTAFIAGEAQRLLNMMAEASAIHEAKFSQRLDVGDVHLTDWIYKRGLGCRRIYGGKKRRLSVRGKDLLELICEETKPETQESLALIFDYKLAQSQMMRIRPLESKIDRHTARIHSSFNDIQSSGRVSSRRPNLQQIAKMIGPKQTLGKESSHRPSLQQIAKMISYDKKKQFVSDAFSDVTIKSRNAIMATPGYEMVAFDIAQADIRVLAHAVDSFPYTAEAYLKHLQDRRLHRLVPAIGGYCDQMWTYFQPENRKVFHCPHCSAAIEVTERRAGTTIPCPVCQGLVELPPKYPGFDPADPCALAKDFCRGDSDFYTVATERMLGRLPKDKTERNHMKQTILGIVNGMSAAGLAARLDVDKDVAKGYMTAFAKAYPKVEAFRELTRHAFAITGESWTFADHHRRITPHWWMGTRSQVDLFISYKGADKLWVRVVPLRPNRHTLTCWVLRVIDARYGSQNEHMEIYNSTVGRISQAPYKFFQDGHLVFRLPVRNIPWRMIRRVRTGREEARYEGFDKTWRQLFNHVAQGGTADIVKTMMVRAQPVCAQFDAHLLLQIHDELVFEVPKRRSAEFSRAMRRVLLAPPTNDFRVPIVVEPSAGTRFGDMVLLGPAVLSDYRLVRLWHGWIVPFWRRLWNWIKKTLARARTPAFLLMRPFRAIWRLWQH